MRKIICIIILFSAICGNIFSQTGRKLSESEAQVFEQKMLEQLKKNTTLQCVLVLEKTASSAAKTVMRGTMMYQSPSKLRWEYSDPTPSTLILNGHNAALLNKNGKKNEANEKMLKQLGNFIILMISGRGITQQNKMFSPDFYELANAQMLVVLTPVQKRMKDLYNKIELKIDQKTMLPNDITLDEKSGDKTVISLKNKVLNIEIQQDKFIIR